MTKANWMACTEPLSMLEFLRPRVSERKLRLFSIACCRRICKLLPTECRSALETAEQFVEGLASLASLNAVRQTALHCFSEFSDFDPDGSFIGRESASAAMAGACWTNKEEMDQGLHDVINNCFGLGPLSNGFEDGNLIEYCQQCHDIRDIFGDPFHTLQFESLWFTPEVRTVAQDIYDTLAFDRMQELAKALQSVGCDDMALLDHCLKIKDHVRGCWVLDIVLGRK